MSSITEMTWGRSEPGCATTSMARSWGGGGLKKVADLPDPDPCMNPSHFPPNMIVLPPGIYEHTCPGCGAVTRFTVPAMTC